MAHKSYFAVDLDSINKMLACFYVTNTCNKKVHKQQATRVS